MRRTTTRLSALALTVTLVSAGCSGGDDEGSDDPSSSSAPDTSPAATPSPEETSAAVDDRGADQALEDAVDATLANRAFTIAFEAQLEIQDQQLGLTAEGSVDYDATIADVRLGVEQSGQSQDVEILADGGTAWVAVAGDQAPEVPDGATYVSGDASALAESASFSPEDLIGVAIVLRAGDDAEAGEPEEVDGVEAATWSFTVPYEDAVAAAGEDAEAFQSALSLTGGATASDLLVEAAVGPDDVVRRLTISIDGGDLPVGGTYDLELSDVGQPVEPPEAPADDDIATGPEAEALFAQLLG